MDPNKQNTQKHNKKHKTKKNKKKTNNGLLVAKGQVRKVVFGADYSNCSGFCVASKGGPTSPNPLGSDRLFLSLPFFVFVVLLCLLLYF